MTRYIIFFIVLCIACNRNQSIESPSVMTFYFDYKFLPNKTYLVDYVNTSYQDYIINTEENDERDVSFPYSGKNRVGKTYQFQIKTGNITNDTLSLILINQVSDINMQGSIYDNFDDNNEEFKEAMNKELNETQYGHIINQEEFKLDSISPPSAEFKKGVNGALWYWKVQDRFPKGPMSVGDTFTYIHDKFKEDTNNQKKVQYILQSVSDEIGYFDIIIESNFSKYKTTNTSEGTGKLEYNFANKSYQNKHSIVISETTMNGIHASSITTMESIDTLTITVIND